MFASSVNPTTGKLEWIAQDRDVTSEEADISHELARSQYGDMLLDKSRVSCLSSILNIRHKAFNNIVLGRGLYLTA